MGKCNIDHSQTDVLKKFQSQREFLPEELVDNVENYLQQERSQLDLNELFHLLKKYDLATSEIQKGRDEKLALLVGVK